MTYYFQKKRKAVSPLIAAVLLIAFTMAIAALLTAWVTQFTKQQQDESEQYQEKIECAGSNFIVNKDFNLWINVFDKGNLSTRLENIGFNPIRIKNIQIWYDNQNLPEYLNFSNMEIVEDDDLQINIDLYETESGSMSAGTVGGVKKLQFLSTCDGVWFILERPIGGWNTQP
ncbi:MAG: type IV pilin [Candidatus Aenigmarchaeota archaeon]|nr:type IV pilin [Candidatus Aenigmarchaeota archaeon]MCK5372731.1 type IV pilin [Candidatus Aenigmarchaeota archaeon]